MMNETKRKYVEEFVQKRLTEVPTETIDKMISDGIVIFKDITPYKKGDERPYSYNNNLPMWGKMWKLDKECRDRLGGVYMAGFYGYTGDHYEKVKDIGFTIYESTPNIWSRNYDIYLGIDNGGCNFYEQYWEPLYSFFAWHEKIY